MTLKILHIIASVRSEGGGPIEGIRQFYKAFRNEGVEVNLVSCDSPDSEFLKNPALPKVYAMGPSFLKYSYTPRLASWLEANAGNYDAIIVNGLWQYPSYAAWRVLKKMEVPYFVFTHGMLDPWFKKKYPFKHIKKWLYWPWAEYRVLRDAKAVIFTCEEERVLARESFSLYRVNEAVTSYGTNSPPSNSSELSLIFLEKFPILKGRKFILFLSRIHEKKGCDLLIEAFSRVLKEEPNLMLVMAGPDESGIQSSLRKRSEALGIQDSVLWVGMLQGDLKWGAFYSSEVFCLPSHQENFGIVVAEALACSKPVLISDRVNIWREVVGAGAGFVDSDNVDGAERLLRQWIKCPDLERENMGKAAKKLFDEKFHMKIAASRLLQIISANSSSSN